MSADDLYAAGIVEHGTKPRNKHPITGADVTCFKSNPSCGDELRVSAKLSGDKLAEVAFEGDGCLVSLASASMLTEAVTGKTRAEALARADAARQYFSKLDRVPDAMPELSAFAGLARFPVRRACARLAWDALATALEKKG